jgi:hypothetical protein
VSQRAAQGRELDRAEMPGSKRWIAATFGNIMAL